MKLFEDSLRRLGAYANIVAKSIDEELPLAEEPITIRTETVSSQANESTLTDRQAAYEELRYWERLENRRREQTLTMEPEVR